MEFLGVNLKTGEVHMSEKKVKAILDWPVPQNVKQVQGFLGLANYYRRFVKKFSDASEDMNILMHKDKEWEWGDKQQKSFELIKKKIASHEVIVMCDPSKRCRDGSLAIKEMRI